ncbi:hypothetical protein PG997_008573 [Apiospora hydei]|uniref:Hikeshi-like domain-containing protein n=1 Tax=Apiospora hydei TaxID=1337664 RepID=A0ABR1WB76_9PEZI
MAAPTQPLFGILPTGHPLVTEPPFRTYQSSLLPGITLPENTAAAIYLATNPEVLASGGQPNFRFLGGVGPGKESAVYKVGATGGQEGIVVGVSIEDAASVASRIEELSASKTDGTNSPSGALVKAGAQTPTTQVLAQRIIKNAFNFLASFSGQAGQVEVVPLRAFEDWWRKFESRVRSDPTFLEREQE